MNNRGPSTNIQLKRYKRDFEHSYTFGVFPTLELLRHRPRSVLRVIANTRSARNEGVTTIREVCGREGIPFEINDKLVERLSPAENFYAIGVFSKYSTRLNPSANHVAIVNPADMGNLGTIVRTMAGFGVRDLAIVRPAADIFDPRVIRASMGALFQISFQYFDTFDDYSVEYPRGLYPFMTNGEVSIHAATFAQPFTLIFGNESAGLPDDFHNMGTAVAIPHSASIDSLNLPVAVAIALFQATKSNFPGSH